MTKPLPLFRLGLLCLGYGIGLCSVGAAQSDGIFREAHSVPQSPSDYRPITPDKRMKWFVRATVGPQSLTGGLFSAGFGTAINSPHEYGTHWSGFGDRYGMRLTGISTGNAMEAGLGAVWGEDPRYFRAAGQPFKRRVLNILDLTARSYRRDGERHLAYARYSADLGNNFLSNTWRVPSDSTASRAMIRSAEGMGGRALSNTFREFWPNVARLIHHVSRSN